MSIPTAITQPVKHLIGRGKTRINGQISDDGGEACDVRFRWRETGGSDGIAWGTASEFTSVDVLLFYYKPFISIAAIDDNKFVVAYCDFDDSGDPGKARVGTVNGTTITWGDISEFCNQIATGSSTGVCKLDTNKFVVVYADDWRGDDGYARVGTVDGTTISWGEAVEFETGDAEQMQCVQLGTDRFAIVYNDESDSDTWKVVVCTVSGTTITAGTPATLIAGDVDNSYKQTGICKLADDKFAAFVSDGDENGIVYAITVDWDTLALTVGTGVEIEDADCSSCALAQLGTDKFVAVWNENGNIRTNVCTVATRTITKGTEQNSGYHPSGSGLYGSTLGVTAVGTDEFIIVFEDSTHSGRGKSGYCIVSGTTVTFGSWEVFHDAYTETPAVCVLVNPFVAVCVYCDDADASDHGEAIAGSLAAAWTTLAWDEAGYNTNDTFHHDLTDLDFGTEYEFQVQAKNTDGEGNWSVSVNFTPTVVGSFPTFFR